MPTFAPNVIPAGNILTVPVASAGVTATAGAANTYGVYIQLDDGTLVTEAMRLVSVSIKTPSAGCVGKVQIVSDEAGTPAPLAEQDFEIATDAGGYLNIAIPTGGVIPNAATIGARIKTVAGGTTLAIGCGIQPVG